MLRDYDPQQDWKSLGYQFQEEEVWEDYAMQEVQTLQMGRVWRRWCWWKSALRDGMRRARRGRVRWEMAMSQKLKTKLPVRVPQKQRQVLKPSLPKSVRSCTWWPPVCLKWKRLSASFLSTRMQSEICDDFGLSCITALRSWYWNCSSQVNSRRFVMATVKLPRYSFFHFHLNLKSRLREWHTSASRASYRFSTIFWNIKLVWLLSLPSDYHSSSL